MIINHEEINFTRGLGFALSPIFFNIYINNIIRNQYFSGQVYVYDTIIQVKDIKIL